MLVRGGVQAHLPHQPGRRQGDAVDDRRRRRSRSRSERRRRDDAADRHGPNERARARAAIACGSRTATTRCCCGSTARVVEFDGPTTYRLATIWSSPHYSAADPGDLAPAGIGSRGAAVKLSSLRIFRDKYYIATTGNWGDDDYDYSQPRAPSRFATIFRDPSQWDCAARPVRPGKPPARRVSRWTTISSCRWATTARKAPTAASGCEDRDGL